MGAIIHVSVLVTKERDLLIVQEGAGRSRGKWNLPGGGLEFGEGLAAGAQREVREETGLEVQVDSLIGIYTGCGEHYCINFVFHGEASEGMLTAQAGEILQCRWCRPAEVLEIPDDQILNPRKMKRIICDLENGVRFPLSLIAEGLYGM